MPLILLATLSVAGAMERPQIAQSQTDYEEYIIMESVDQGINQQNIGSGSSTNINCGANTAGTNLAQPITCPSPPDGGNGNPPLPQAFTTTIVSDSTQIQSARTTLEVSCPEGTEVTGGGHDLIPIGDQIYGAGDFLFEENEPTENGWKVSVLSGVIRGGEPFALLTVYAVCGTLVSPT